MTEEKITIRLAEESDLEVIEALMKRSMHVLGQGHYSEEQVKSCCRYVCVPELQLIKDRTFFVAIKNDGSIVGCGGWSFRNTLYAGPKKDPLKENPTLDPQKDSARIRAMFIDPQESGKGIGSLIMAESENAAKKYGFKRGTLGATLSGLAFYKSKGWRAVAEEQATLPDGVVIAIVRMEKEF